jgi:hypothetical protein
MKPEDEKAEITSVMNQFGVDEHEARFIIALGDGTITGDIIDPGRKRQTLREAMIENGELKER